MSIPEPNGQTETQNPVGSSELVLPQPTGDLIAAFHEHLDACSQCRNHPFALCAEGAKRLLKAAAG